MYDIIVIGAGPAGASAALFTAKAGKRTLVIDNGKSITKKAWVENHYGVSETSGPDLVDTGLEQVKKFGAEVIETDVSKVESLLDGVRVEAENGSYDGKHLILATGMMADLAEKSGIATKEGTEPRIKKIVDVDASGKTDKEGIWAAGTCAGKSVHTIITSGHGAEVAINVISEMNQERYVDHDVLK